MVDDTQIDAPAHETAAATDAAKKQAVSKRDVLNASGAPQDEWIGAEGFAYTILKNAFELKVMFNELPDAVRNALAAFGGLTLAGNTTNTVRNGVLKGTDTSEAEKEALVAWLENLKAGNWTTPRGEVQAGLNTLAEAYVRAKAAEGVTLELEATLEKLKAASEELRGSIRKSTPVKAALAAIAAERAAARNKEAPTL